MFLMSFQNKGAIIRGPTFTLSPKYFNHSDASVPSNDPMNTREQSPNADSGDDDDDDDDGGGGGSGDDDDDVVIDKNTPPERKRAIQEASKERRYVRVVGSLSLRDFPVKADTDGDDFSFVKQDAAEKARRTKRLNLWKQKERARRNGFGETGEDERLPIEYVRWMKMKRQDAGAGGENKNNDFERRAT